MCCLTPGGVFAQPCLYTSYDEELIPDASPWSSEFTAMNLLDKAIDLFARTLRLVSLTGPGIPTYRTKGSLV